MKHCAFAGCFSWGPFYKIRLKNPKTGSVDFNTVEVCNSHREEARKAGVLAELDAVPAPKIVEVEDRARPGLGRLWEGESIKQKGVTMPVCSVCKMRNGKNQGGKVICRSCKESKPAEVEAKAKADPADAGWSSSVEVVPRRDIEDLKGQVAGLEQDGRDKDTVIADLKAKLELADRNLKSAQTDLDEYALTLEEIDMALGFDPETMSERIRLDAIRSVHAALEEVDRALGIEGHGNDRVDFIKKLIEQHDYTQATLKREIEWLEANLNWSQDVLRAAFKQLGVDLAEIPSDASRVSGWAERRFQRPQILLTPEDLEARQRMLDEVEHIEDAISFGKPLLLDGYELNLDVFKAPLKAHAEQLRQRALTVEFGGGE